MKNYWKILIFLFFGAILAPGLFFPSQTKARLGHEINALGSFAILDNCRRDFLNENEYDYYFNVPSDYTSDQVLVWGDSTAFIIKIDVCQDKSECNVRVTPSQTLTFNVEFAGNPDEAAAMALQYGKCSTRIGVTRADKSSGTVSTPVPTAATSTPVPTLTSEPTSTGEPYGWGRPSSQWQCEGDSDCIKYTCGTCNNGQQICVEGNCVECITNEQCEDGFYCSGKKCLGERASPKPLEIKVRTPVCGDSYCDYEDANENCENCPQDCQWPGYCCQPKYGFMYSQDYNNKIFKINKNPGGLIPNGAFMIAEDEPETGFYDNYKPMLCDNSQLKFGQCVRDSQCPAGVCLDYKCIYTGPTEKSELEEMGKDVSEKYIEGLSEHKQYYVHAYYASKDNFVIHDQNESLDIKLEVQGATSGKILRAITGKEIQVLMTIKNRSDYRLALVPLVNYPGHSLKKDTDLEETSYHIAYSWMGILNSLKGKFQSAFSDGKYFILPAGGIMTVESQIIPHKEGYLDVEGLVYFTSGKRYIEENLGLGYIKNERLPEEYEKEAQKAEVSETIYIEKPRCLLGIVCF